MLSTFSKLADAFTGSSKVHRVEKNLLTSLGLVRQEVKNEYNWFKVGCVLRYPQETECIDAKRKRLLYLFIRDLMSGVGGNVLDNKDSRENVKIEKVTPYSKVGAWIFVFLVNSGILFYIYLFARTQTQSRQSAWFISFVMWLLFEIIVSSTAVVLVTHLLIPLYVLSDIRNIKKKVLSDILAFRKASLQRRGMMLDAVSKAESSNFNAAKYLYRSWRIASLFPELKESEIILSFQSPWPPGSFKKVTASVRSVYERRYSFISQAVSRIAIFFLASLLHLPQIAQDALIQMTSSSGLGYIILMLIRLYSINPFLVGVPILALALFIHFGVNSSIKSEQIKRARDLHPLEEEAESTLNPKTGDSNEAKHAEEEVEWEDNDDFIEGSPPLIFASAERKLAEGRRLSHFMLNNLRNDLGVDASTELNLSASFWTNEDQDSEGELFQRRLNMPLEMSSCSSPSLQGASSQDSSPAKNIIWDDDDDQPIDGGVVDIDSNISVEFWDAESGVSHTSSDPSGQNSQVSIEFESEESSDASATVDSR